MTDPALRPQAEPELRPASEFLLIMLRAVAGYMILFVCFMLMVKRETWRLSVLDICFWLVVVLLVVLRLRDPQPGGGRFALGLGGICLLLWAGANSLHWVA